MRAQRPAAPRGAPSSSGLSGILGAGARRRGDIEAAARFGGNGAAAAATAAAAKLLRPSASRAAGRTTMLSSSSAPPGSRNFHQPLPGQREEGQPKARAVAAVAVVASAGRSKASTGRAEGDRSGGDYGAGVAPSSPAGNEDLLRLPWAYGSEGGSDRGSGDAAVPPKPGGAGAGVNRVASGSAGIAAASGKKKRQVDGSAATTVKGRGGGGGDGGGGVENGEGKLTARPPREAHPAGYMDGTVAVPAQSSVFLTMPQRFAVRADGSRTTEGAKMLADAQVRFVLDRKRLCTRSSLHGVGYLFMRSLCAPKITPAQQWFTTQLCLR